MAANWYTFDDDEMKGPMPSAELLQRARQGNVRPTTRVRKGEDGEWVLAERVKGLFDASATCRNRSIVAAEPRRAIATTDMPVIHVALTPKRNKSRRPYILLTAAALVGFICLAVILFVLPGDKDSLTSKAEANPPLANNDVTGIELSREPQRKNGAVATTPVTTESKTEQLQQDNSTANIAKKEVTYFDLYQMFELIGFNTVSWSLGTVDEHVKYPLSSPGQVARQIATLKRGADDGRSDLIVENTDALSKFVDSLGFIGVKFLHSDSLPIEIRSKDGQRCLVVNNVAATDVYNTLRLSEKQRAAKALQSFAFPVLQELDKRVYDANIPYYCVVVYYGGKNFTNRGLTGIDGEVLALVVSRDDCHGFGRGRLSQENVLSKSELFIGSMSVKPRRVDVTLE